MMEFSFSNCWYRQGWYPVKWYHNGRFSVLPYLARDRSYTTALSTIDHLEVQSHPRSANLSVFTFPCRQSSMKNLPQIFNRQFSIVSKRLSIQIFGIVERRERIIFAIEEMTASSRQRRASTLLDFSTGLQTFICHKNCCTYQDSSNLCASSLPEVERALSMEDEGENRWRGTLHF